MNVLLPVALILILQVPQIATDNTDFSVITNTNQSLPAGRTLGATVDTVDGCVYFWGQSSNGVVLTKLAPNGTLLWRSQYGNSYSFAGDIVGPNPIIDQTTRDVYVAGITRSTIDWQQPQPKLGEIIRVNAPIQWNDGRAVDMPIVMWIADQGLFVSYVVGFLLTWQSYAIQTQTSADGVNWVNNGALINSLSRISTGAWSPTLKVFVAINNPAQYLFTSLLAGPSYDASTWTVLTSPPQQIWRSVCWSAELKIFVAVAGAGSSLSGRRVITSNNGYNWTVRNTPADYDWTSVVWGNRAGRFAAVAASGGFDRVMHSTDGINWVLGAVPEQNEWTSVCYSEVQQLFVAVAQTGTGNRVITSQDGIIWFLRSSAADNPWTTVSYLPDIDLFIALARSGTANRIMTSPNGIDWTSRPTAFTNPSDYSWNSVSYSPTYKTLVMCGSGAPAGYGVFNNFNLDTIFVSRFLGANGARIWTRLQSGAFQTGVNAMSQTNTSLIIGGYAAGPVNGATAFGNTDNLLMSVDKSTAAVRWTRQFGTAAADQVNAIAINSASTILYAAGTTAGSLVGFTNAGGLDFFISQHDANNGSLIGSALQFGSSGNDAVYSIAISPVQPSMLYLAGYASGAVQSGLNSIVSNGPDQMFAALNLTASTLMWTQFVGGIGGSDAAMGLAIHPTTGVVYASGFIGAAVASSVTRAQGTFYGNVDLTLSSFNQTNGSLLWTIVAGTSSLDQGFGISFNTNGVLFMATRWNSSDGYLVFNLDATGNNSFPAPNTTAGAFQLNICYSSPWISTSTRTVFTTLTETMTPALVTQINSQTVFSTVTSTVVQSTTITQTSVIIQPALVTPTTITDCSNSNTGSRNENISGGLSADGNVLIILVIVVIILVVIIGVITSFSFSRVRRSMHELKKDNNGANNSFGFGYIRARNSSVFGNATTGLMTSIKEQNIMDENNTMQKMEQSAGVQRYLETSPGIF